MNRDLLAARAEGYRDGLQAGRSDAELMCLTREAEAYREGRQHERHRQHHYAWLKLFVIVLIASTIGAGIALAVTYVVTL